MYADFADFADGTGESEVRKSDVGSLGSAQEELHRIGAQICVSVKMGCQNVKLFLSGPLIS